MVLLLGAALPDLAVAEHGGDHKSVFLDCPDSTNGFCGLNCDIWEYIPFKIIEYIATCL